MALSRPAKLLPIKFYLGSTLTPDTDGLDYQYEALLKMTNPVQHSSPDYGYSWDLRDINIGDYVSTTGNGRIMKIVAIASASATQANITVEDDFRLNQRQDSSTNSIPYIESQNGVVFEVKEGRPILFPYSEYSTTIVGFIKDYASEIISRFAYLRQDTLVTVTQAHPGIGIGDLITYKNNGYYLLDLPDVYLGTVVEVGNPTSNSFRFKPNGVLLDISIPGTGPYFYWDVSNPGHLTETQPLPGNREVLAFFKLSDTQVIFFSGNDPRSESALFVTLTTDQTISGQKTFTAPLTTFTQDVEIGGDLNITGDMNLSNLTLSGNLVVQGNATLLETTNTSISDQLIELNYGYTGPPLSSDSGIVVNRGPSEDNLFFGWDESSNQFTVGTGIFNGNSTGELTLTDASVRFGNTEITGTLNVAGQTTLTSATVQNLVENTIVVAGAAGILESDPNLTWDGTTLGVTGTGVAFTTGRVELLNQDESSVEHTMYVLYGTTVNTTQTELYLDSSDTQILIAPNTTMMFEATVVGRDSSGSKYCAFKLEGVLDRTGATTVLINNISETIVAETTASWSVLAEADDINDALAIKVTGDTSTIKWTAFVKTVSITH